MTPLFSQGAYSDSIYSVAFQIIDLFLCACPEAQGHGHVFHRPNK